MGSRIRRSSIFGLCVFVDFEDLEIEFFVLATDLSYTKLLKLGPIV